MMNDDNSDGDAPPKCNNTKTPDVISGADEDIVLDPYDPNNQNSRNEAIVGECEDAPKEEEPSPTSSCLHFESSEQDLINNVENLQALRDQLNTYRANESYKKAAALYQASLIANMDSDHDIKDKRNSENDSTINK